MAVFNAALATNNVPKWWLAQCGLTNFNTDAMQDIDRDGMVTWQEWVAGCKQYASHADGKLLHGLCTECGAVLLYD